ncbi:MAG: acyl-CoA-binding protein [Candidatus Promineifilaceae bacterium]|nr:acyl-CoA-binding protein [Candidatus Promineifilaceae bacterium]
MNDLQVQFETAAEQATNLPKRPDNETMLKLYSFYKQATVGDVAGKRPGFTDFVGRAKYDAWSKLKGMDKEAAKQSYVDLVNQLSGSSGSVGYGD